MKKIFFSLLLLTFFHSASSQHNWVQRLSYLYNGPNQYIYDSLDGVKFLGIGADGDIFVAGKYGLDMASRLYKISSTGSPVLWSVPLGYHHSPTNNFINAVHPTSDSGCIVSFNMESYMCAINGIVVKYSKDGLVQWADTILGSCSFPYYNNEAFDAIENISGNYYALVGDTLYEFDAGGTIIRRDTSTNGNRILEMQNGNLIIQKSDTLFCKPFGGNILWTANPVSQIALKNGCLFTSIDSSVSKIDPINGSIIWTKTYPWPVADLSITPDNGFVACVGYKPGPIQCLNCHEPGILFRADSSGDTLWSKIYTLPYYGLSDVEVTDSAIITGGAYIFKTSNDVFFPHEYNCFIASLDSMGNGMLQTTENIWPGNADNDSYLNFSVDGLYMVLDFGKTGYARDTIGFLTSNGPCCLSDYAWDWPDTSVSGPNLKYSDFNGDGIIDSSDVLCFVGTVGDAYPLPAFRFSNASLQPTLYIVPESDSIAPGDTVNFNIILGSQAQPFDTICGTAFTGLLALSFNIASHKIISLNSDLGTIGNDLYNEKWIYPGDHFISCRTNHQDVYNLNDTIGKIEVVITNTIYISDSIYFYPWTYNAVKCNGEIIPMNIVCLPAIVDSGLLSIRAQERQQIMIYPNPASGVLKVKYKNSNKGVTIFKIFNSTGLLIKQIEKAGDNVEISVEDFPGGIYLLSAQTENSVYHHSFTVLHR